MSIPDSVDEIWNMENRMALIFTRIVNLNRSNESLISLIYNEIISIKFQGSNL